MPRILLLACAVMGGAAALADPLPIEHFTRFDEFGTLKISPEQRESSFGSGELITDFADRETVGVCARAGDYHSGFSTST